MMIKTPNIWEMGPYKSLTNSMANFVYKKIRELERLKNKRYSCFFIRNMGHGKNYKTAFEKLKINQLKSD